MWKYAVECLEMRLCNVFMNSPKKVGHFGLLCHCSEISLGRNIQ